MSVASKSRTPERDVAPVAPVAIDVTATPPADAPPVPFTAAPQGASPPTTLFADLDRRFHAAEGVLTKGESPLALWLAGTDWATHLANAPFRRTELALDAASGWLRLWLGAVKGQPTQPRPGDHRFTDPQWKALPFNLYAQAFLAAEAWVEKATTGLPGVSPENERLISFAARQWCDALAPSNLPWANPEVLQATWSQSGGNLLAGAQNFFDDLAKLTETASPDRDGGLKVGRDLAATPGKVVFRNELIELLQYSPQTETVRPEPVLITPAWIMKYYILDLSSHNSLIQYLVQQGYTVFCISWRNPGAEMRDVLLDAYRSEGVAAALDAVSSICPDTKVHACGYCLGGTLLTIAAAAMARSGDERLKDVTLFCAQMDFTEAGELQLFTTEDQVAFLDDVMACQGYLDGKQMGGAFELLRSRDLIWSRLMRTYWMGEKDQPNDLMTWNDDTTRMPARMHSEYLRELFLRNDLAEGRFQVEGAPVSVGDIRVPFFVVSTETDHVAPWRSVYKINLLNDGEITYVLTTGGHNAGIVSEPGHPHRSFHIATRRAGELYAGPDAWLAKAEREDGSWWPAWTKWLDDRSAPQDRPSPSMGAVDKGYPPIEDTPGHYVFER